MVRHRPTVVIWHAQHGLAIEIGALTNVAKAATAAERSPALVFHGRADAGRVDRCGTSFCEDNLDGLCLVAQFTHDEVGLRSVLLCHPIRAAHACHELRLT